MPAPLPLTDLLELLQERKMEIGVREHLTIGRLLSRWDNTDVEAFRDAIAAVLARNQEEVATVRSAFDELYRAPVGEKPVPPPPTSARSRERRSLRWAFLALAATAALGLVLGALLWPRPEPPGPQPIASPGPSPSPPPKVERPPIPTIPDTYLRPDWDRVLLGAAGIASGLLLGLYRVRLRRAAERAARRRWHEELEELPEPQGYEIELGDVVPPFPPAVLDEAASLLGRSAPVSPRFGALDIDRSLQQTLRAGLAPQVVFRARSAAPSLVVLEDIGSSMAPWRGRVSALLAGLAARGVPLDRWQFHADAGRVFRSLGEHEISLRQLARMRAPSPLLVISTGEGVLHGWEGRIAPWIEQLPAWPHRAWLHPVGDPESWHPVLRQQQELKISLWPMTPEGLLLAARHLAHGQPGPARATWRTAADRPVAPLDVDRLRWLLSLTPRRDPDLLERLRQEFCPHVPQAALLEALDAPPPATPFGLPPAAEAVHAFLADLLTASEPKPGTAAHERWRLDRAIQEIRIPEREKRALSELMGLARGPLAGQVGDAIEDLTARATGSPEPPLSGQVACTLRRAVLVPIRRRASRFRLGGWRRVPLPSWWASAAAILAALLAVPLLPEVSPVFNNEEPVRQETRYTLRLIDDKQTGPFRFEMSGSPQWRRVERDLVGFKRWPLGHFPTSLVLQQSDRGSWYYICDVNPDTNGVLGISNYEWVEPPILPPPPPLVPEPEPVQTTSEEPTVLVTDFASAQPTILTGTVAEERRSRLAALEENLTAFAREFLKLSNEDRKKNRGFSEAISRLRAELGIARKARRSENSDLDALESEVEEMAYSWQQVELVSGPLLATEQRRQEDSIGVPAERLTIVFSEGTHYLTGMSMAKLDELAFRLKQDSGLIAHLASKSDGKESKNPQGLALDRVKVVQNYLVRRQGIGPSRLRFSIDFGNFEPTTEELEENSRYTIIEIFQGAGAPQ